MPAARTGGGVNRNLSAPEKFAFALPSQNATIRTAPSRTAGLGDALMNHAIQAQRAFWNSWNASTREQRLSEISRDQREVVLQWLSEAGRNDLNIIEVGCGAGWLCPFLARFGKVTATDLSDEVLARAQARVPEVAFVAGDFMELGFPAGAFDVVVSLEMLSHVADHDAFVAKMAGLLKPGGKLILATQNRAALERYNRVEPQAEGQLRRWFDRDELRALLSRHLTVRRLTAITPHSNKGFTRLIAGRWARRLMRLAPGRFVERALAPEFGWTLMALAEKPSQSA
ncbi:MAG: class I SAM-dependent methyltransferase [Caulobacteraceae bacterium]